MRTFIVDSFTDEPFKGNPAGVCLLESPLEESQMQAIAKELNFSETTFVVPETESGRFSIRYFSPIMEIPLCGHATLAASKVIFKNEGLEKIQFTTGRGVQLNVSSRGEKIVMEFPVYDLEPRNVPAAVLDALGVEQDQYVNSAYNPETQVVLLEIKGDQVLETMAPDFGKLVDSIENLHGLSVTAKSSRDEFDFCSRFFWPWSGGDEDPVTGAVHTFLSKYWGERLGKTQMRSLQASERTGSMNLELLDNGNLLIEADAVILFEGDWVAQV